MPSSFMERDTGTAFLLSRSGDDGAGIMELSLYGFGARQLKGKLADNDHKKYSGEYSRQQVSHFDLQFISQQIEPNTEDEQPTHSGHLSDYGIRQKWLDINSSKCDSTLVEKHRQCGKSNPNPHGGGENSCSYSVNNRFDEQCGMVPGKAALQRPHDSHSPYAED
jgi:hypothetical protein